MASLLVKARDLGIGDTILLPMGKTATINDIKPIGPRTIYVRFRTEHGWTRVEVDYEVSVKVGVTA